MVNSHLISWHPIVSNCVAVASGTKLNILEIDEEDTKISPLETPSITCFDWKHSSTLQLAYGTSTGNVVIVNPARGDETILATKRSCNVVSWNHLDRHKVTVGQEAVKGSDSSMFVWDLEHDATLKIPFTETCSAIAWHADHPQQLLFGNTMGTIRLVDLRIHHTASSSAASSAVYSLQAHPATRPRRIKGIRTNPLLSNVAATFTDAPGDVVKIWDLRVLGSSSSLSGNKSTPLFTVHPYQTATSAATMNAAGYVVDVAWSPRSPFTIATATSCQSAIHVFRCDHAPSAGDLASTSASAATVVAPGSTAAPLTTAGPTPITSHASAPQQLHGHSTFTLSTAHHSLPDMTIPLSEPAKAIAWQGDMRRCGKYRNLLLAAHVNGSSDFSSLTTPTSYVRDNVHAARLSNTAEGMWESSRAEERRHLDHTDDRHPQRQYSTGIGCTLVTNESGRDAFGLLAIATGSGVLIAPSHNETAAAVAYTTGHVAYGDNPRRSVIVAPCAELCRAATLGDYMTASAEERQRDRTLAGYSTDIACNIDILTEEIGMLSATIAKMKSSGVSSLPSVSGGSSGGVGGSSSGIGMAGPVGGSSSTGNAVGSGAVTGGGNSIDLNLDSGTDAALLDPDAALELVKLKRALGQVQEIQRVWQWLARLLASIQTLTPSPSALILLQSGARGLMRHLQASTPYIPTTRVQAQMPIPSAAVTSQAMFNTDLGLTLYTSKARADVLSLLCGWPATSTSSTTTTATTASSSSSTAVAAGGSGSGMNLPVGVVAAAASAAASAAGTSTSTTSSSTSAAAVAISSSSVSSTPVSLECQAVRLLWRGQIDQAVSLLLSGLNAGVNKKPTSSGVGYQYHHHHVASSHPALQSTSAQYEQLVELTAECLAGYQPNSNSIWSMTDSVTALMGASTSMTSIASSTTLRSDSAQSLEQLASGSDGVGLSLSEADAATTTTMAVPVVSLQLRREWSDSEPYYAAAGVPAQLRSPGRRAHSLHTTATAAAADAYGGPSMATAAAQADRSKLTAWARMVHHTLDRWQLYAHSARHHAMSQPPTARATLHLHRTNQTYLRAVLHFLLVAEEHSCVLPPSLMEAPAATGGASGAGVGTATSTAAPSVSHAQAMEAWRKQQSRRQSRVWRVFLQESDIMQQIPFLDRLAFASIFLHDDDFFAWIDSQLPGAQRRRDGANPSTTDPTATAAAAAAASSNAGGVGVDTSSLEALALVGLETADSVAVLQAHIDQYDDLQTVALLAIMGVFRQRNSAMTVHGPSPSLGNTASVGSTTFTGGNVAAAATPLATALDIDRMLARWVLQYRSLLVNWEIVAPRVALDEAINTQSATFPYVFFTNYQGYEAFGGRRTTAFTDACTVFRTADALPKDMVKKHMAMSAMRLRCNYCGAALPPLHLLIDLWKQKQREIGRLKNEKRVLNFCIRCAKRQHLPRCYVCQLFVGLLNPYRLVESLTEQGKQLKDAINSVQRQYQQQQQQQQQRALAAQQQQQQQQQQQNQQQQAQPQPQDLQQSQQQPAGVMTTGNLVGTSPSTMMRSVSGPAPATTMMKAGYARPPPHQGAAGGGGGGGHGGAGGTSSYYHQNRMLMGRGGGGPPPRPPSMAVPLPPAPPSTPHDASSSLGDVTTPSSAVINTPTETPTAGDTPNSDPSLTPRRPLPSSAVGPRAQSANNLLSSSLSSSSGGGGGGGGGGSGSSGSGSNAAAGGPGNEIIAAALATAAREQRDKDKSGFNDLALPFDDWLLVCQRCRHGGHSACLRRWFSRMVTAADVELHHAATASQTKAASLRPRRGPRRSGGAGGGGGGQRRRGGGTGDAGGDRGDVYVDDGDEAVGAFYDDDGGDDGGGRRGDGLHSRDDSDGYGYDDEDDEDHDYDYGYDDGDDAASLLLCYPTSAGLTTRSANGHLAATMTTAAGNGAAAGTSGGAGGAGGGNGGGVGGRGAGRSRGKGKKSSSANAAAAAAAAAAAFSRKRQVCGVNGCDCVCDLSFE